MSAQSGVKSQEVVSGQIESGHRYGAANALVRAVPVVVMVPAVERLGTFAGVLIGEAISPLAQRRLDEPFGFAIGLRTVRARESVSDAQRLARSGEVLGAERRTVVGEQPAHRDTKACVVGHRVVQELHRLWRLLVRVHGGEGDARMVIDGHKQHLPARSVDRVAPVAGDAVAGALDTPELLGIDVQHIAWRFVLVAHDGLNRIERTQQGQPGTREYSAHGALGHAQRHRDARLSEALAAQLDDGQGLGWIDSAWRVGGSRRCVAKRAFTARQVARQPLARGRRAHAMRQARLRHAQSSLGDGVDHLDSTHVRKSGILVGVHPAGVL